MSNNRLKHIMVFCSLLELTKDPRRPQSEGDSDTKIGYRMWLPLSNLGNNRVIGNNIKIKV